MAEIAASGIDLLSASADAIRDLRDELGLTVVLSVLMAWLMFRTGGSLLPAILFHLAVNDVPGLFGAEFAASLAYWRGGLWRRQAGFEAGLRAAPLANVTRKSLAGQSSEAVAKAYFSAARGAVTQPARSSLGWHVARVDAVTSTPARSK